ncbi:MAG: helix-turn-helix domain-containing protein [Aurantibacter sp.]
MSEIRDLHDGSKATKASKTAGLFGKEKDLNSLSSVFGFVMVVETSNYLNRLEANQFSIFTQKFHKSVSKTLRHFGGFTAKQNNNSYLVLFKTATNAVLCALKIQANFKYVTPKIDAEKRSLKIGISASQTDTEDQPSIEDAVTDASRMCELVANQLVISSTVKKRYESENRNARIDQELIRTLKPWEESFITSLMEGSEELCSKPDFNVGTLSSELELGRAQLYRRLIKLSRKSPNTFIREFKLRRALGLLRRRRSSTISQIARESGFRNAGYFSKCFMDQFGILPSKYIQQHTY